MLGIQIHVGQFWLCLCRSWPRLKDSDHVSTLISCPQPSSPLLQFSKVVHAYCSIKWHSIPWTDCCSQRWSWNKKMISWKDSGGSDSCVKRNGEGKCSGCENASSCGEHRLKNFLCALSLSDYFLFLIVSHLQPLGSLWLVVLEAVFSLKHIMLLYWNSLQLSCDQRE